MRHIKRHLSLGPLNRPIRRAWSREEGVAQHIHTRPISDNDGGHATLHIPLHWDAHWASIKAGLSASA